MYVFLEGEWEANLITLPCNVAQGGYESCTLQPLMDKMIELMYEESVPHERTRTVLKMASPHG
jgi:hypothetical protein